MEIIAIASFFTLFLCFSDLYIQIQQSVFYTNQLHHCFVLKLEDKAMIGDFLLVFADPEPRFNVFKG